MNEFSLITHFFTNSQQTERQDVVLGIGDDCAILKVPPAQQLLVSMDTLVNGVHFPFETAAYDIGYKSLAVNLSDLAAMGATPAWFSLALTLPSLDKSWLEDFSSGLFDLARQFKIQLIGGDTTRGPMTITIQVHGFSPEGRAITRKGAQPGDLIYVTNTLGDAGLALRYIQGHIQLADSVVAPLLTQLNRPLPRIKEGLLLAPYASAMIDLSDGLAADLRHILRQSNTGALIHIEKLPLSKDLQKSVDYATATQLALTAGDDYELCFTIPVDKQHEVEQLMHQEHCAISCIGQITASGLLDLQQDHQSIDNSGIQGYSHF